ncbi:MAG: T9SS type A sorting domain-containing protein [Ferruginibacter sp.]
MKRIIKQTGILYALLFATTFSMAQNNAIFKGGNADGWNANSFQQSSNNITKGGVADGWAVLNYSQQSGNIFKGGNGDGWDTKNYVQSATSIFKGGNGDGWDTKNYVQVSNGIYKGGNGDGWDSKNYLQFSKLIFTGGIGDGWASTYRPQGPLPVTFLFFNANKLNENAALLNWKTSQEINSDRFEVERSNDALNYTKIGSVRAAGISSLPLLYDFTDDKPLPGMNYYRLKQFDLDGRFMYTPSRLVRFDKTDAFAVKYYPNPTTDIIYVEMTETMAKEPAIINLSNASGIVLMQFKLPGNGDKIIPVKLEQYSKGIYFIQVKTANINSTQRIILQ